MQGVTFSGNSEIAIVDVPDPVPGRGEVVVEMRASGLCGTDLKLSRAAPDAPGHSRANP